MEFQLPTQEESQEISGVLLEELRRVYRKGWDVRRMSMEQVAGKHGKAGLSRTLNGRDWHKPSQTTLYEWCKKWYDAGVIDDDEAIRIMNMAGYIDGRYQRQAASVTQKQATLHVRTDELPPVPTQAHTEPVQCSADDAYRASIAAIPTVKVTEADAERMRELKNAGIW